MAEIRVEPKRRTNVWIWLLVALIILAVALWLLVDNGLITFTALGGGAPWPETMTAAGAIGPASAPTRTTWPAIS